MKRFLQKTFIVIPRSIHRCSDAEGQTAQTGPTANIFFGMAIFLTPPVGVVALVDCYD
jgi:hypothetical protein